MGNDGIVDKNKIMNKLEHLIRDPSLATDYGIIYLEDQEFIDSQTGLKFYGRLN